MSVRQTINAPNAHRQTIEGVQMYSDEQIEEMYCEALDEQGLISIGTLQYAPSEVLRKCDPIAYSVGLSDFKADFLSEE